MTLNGFIACSNLAGARASTRSSINVEHYVLALILVFRPWFTIARAIVDARADGAPKIMPKRNITYSVLAMMPRAITEGAGRSKKLGTDQRVRP